MTTVLNKKQQERLLDLFSERPTYLQTINGVQNGKSRNVQHNNKYNIKVNIKTHDSVYSPDKLFEDIRKMINRRGII